LDAPLLYPNMYLVAETRTQPNNGFVSMKQKRTVCLLFFIRE
jgi:hypothetical protein